MDKFSFTFAIAGERPADASKAAEAKEKIAREARRCKSKLNPPENKRILGAEVSVSHEALQARDRPAAEPATVPAIG